MKFISTLVLGLFLFNFAATHQVAAQDPSCEISALYWLNGSWNCAQTDGNYYGSWEISPNGGMAGKAFFVRGSDTLLREILEIYCTPKGMVYTASVNGSEKVVFVMDTHIAGWCFRNPENDDVQNIHYTQTGKDSFEAHVWGNNPDKPEDFVLKMVRIH